MLLARCPLRTRVRITSVDVENSYSLRLQELGVRPGAEFSVVNRAAFGGLVINIAGARIAVDHRSAKKIRVEDAQAHAGPTGLAGAHPERAPQSFALPALALDVEGGVK